jgi:hypothetical protein
MRGEYGRPSPPPHVLPQMRALPIFVFSFTCHQNIVSISNELARPTPRRVLTQAAGAVGAAATVYLVLAHAGYYTFGDMVRGTAAPRVALCYVCVESRGWAGVKLPAST